MDKGKVIRGILKYLSHLGSYILIILLFQPIVDDYSSIYIRFIFYFLILLVGATILEFIERKLSKNRKFMELYLKINPYDTEIRQKLSLNLSNEAKELLDQVEKKNVEIKSMKSKIADYEQKVSKLNQTNEQEREQIAELKQKGHTLRDEATKLLDEQDITLNKAEMLNSKAKEILGEDNSEEG